MSKEKIKKEKKEKSKVRIWIIRASRVLLILLLIAFLISAQLINFFTSLLIEFNHLPREISII